MKNVDTLDPSADLDLSSWILFCLRRPGTNSWASHLVIWSSVMIWWLFQVFMSLTFSIILEFMPAFVKETTPAISESIVGRMIISRDSLGDDVEILPMLRRFFAITSRISQSFTSSPPSWKYMSDIEVCWMLLPTSSSTRSLLALGMASSSSTWLKIKKF